MIYAMVYIHIYLVFILPDFCKWLNRSIILWTIHYSQLHEKGKIF